MRTYNKPPLTYDQQIALLKSRGLKISNEERTKQHLANISYYRLSAYMRPYKQVNSNIILNNFIVGTTWDMVYRLYIFDRKLRLLVFDAIERLEVAIRTQIIYQLSHKYGSHWQDDASIFTPAKTITLHKGRKVIRNVYNDIQNHIKEQLQNNKSEEFINHYCSQYNQPPNPPCWMSIEVMYFNHLSRICTELKKRSDRTDIAAYFSLPPDIFNSWLHTINYVRNICAHHARLWNRGLNIIPKELKFSKNKNWINHPDSVQRNRIYYVLCMLNYLLQTVNPTSTFKNRLKALLDEYNGIVSLEAMGFPQNWTNEKIWKIS